MMRFELSNTKALTFGPNRAVASMRPIIGTGPVGGDLVPRGVWSAVTDYTTLDSVSHNGGVWWAQTDPPVGAEPGVHTAWASRGTPDQTMQATDANPASLFRVQQDARHAATIDAAITEAAPVTVNVAKYGVAPANSAAVNDAGMAALFADYTAGVVLLFAEEGTYNFATAFPRRDNLGLLGTGLATIVKMVGAPLFDLSAGIMRFHSVENISIQNDATTGDHIYKMVAGVPSAGLIQSTWRDCELKTNRDDKSILHFDSVNVVNFFGNVFHPRRMDRPATATVPAFDFAVNNGGGLNGNEFRGGWWHSNGCTTTPFLRVTVAGVASYPHSWDFIGVIGEQSNGGLIHMESAHNIKVHQFVDQDAAGNYTADLFRFSTGAGGLVARGIDVDQSGTAGVGTFDAGKKHLFIGTGGDGHYVGRVLNGPTTKPLLSVPSRGSIVRDVGADAWSLVTVAASQVLSSVHHGVIANGASITITLPNPTTLPVGREFQILNKNATALTVDAAAGTINGAASDSLAQWKGATYRTDGTDWFVFARV